MGLSNIERRLIAAIQDGLPLDPRPYAKVGAEIGLSTASVHRRIRRLREEGVIDAEIAVLNGKKRGVSMTFIIMIEVERERPDLMSDIRKRLAAYPEVHPQAQSEIADLQHLRRKLDAGARRAITQYFFDADCYLRFRDYAAAIGIDKPLVPGILPVHDIDRVIAFSQRCGASVPRHYVDSFARLGTDETAHYQLALELAVALCERLIDEGVEQIHLYTLNQTDMCLDISLALGASVNTPRICPAA